MMRSWVSVVVAPVTLALVLAACAKQDEGQRCDTNNGNDDCESGLACQNIAGSNAPLCCPVAPNPPTVQACIPAQNVLPDAGDDDAAGDAGTDAPADAPPDAPPEAAPDAPSEAAPDAADDVAADAPEDVGTDAAADAPMDSAIDGADAEG